MPDVNLAIRVDVENLNRKFGKATLTCLKQNVEETIEKLKKHLR